MSFPYKSMLSESEVWLGDPAGDEISNGFEALHEALDVSALTGYVCVVGGYAAVATNNITGNIRDGGAAGAGTTNIATTPPGTAGFTDLTPRALTMSTPLADVDKGDWIDWSYDENGTPTLATKGFDWHLTGTYGVPGGVT